MRNIFGYLLILVPLFIGCKKESLIHYEDGSGIYFHNEDILLDTLEIPWGLKNSEVLTQKLTLKVNLIGQVKDYDREFNLVLKDESDPDLQAKPGIDYKEFPLNRVIKAGEASANIEIELLRNPELFERNRQLTVEIKGSDELQFLYSRSSLDTAGNVRELDYQRVLKMTENFPRPRWWSIYGNSLFGKWSATKSILICDLMDIDREVWIGNVNWDDYFTEGLLRYAGVYIHRWLQEQYPVVLDEDGNPMEMGSSSKR